MSQDLQSLKLRPPQEVGFFLLPGFAMMGFSAAIEPLRSANRLSGDQLYNWSMLTIDGAPQQASNGIEITPDYSIESLPVNFDLVIVCAGITNPESMRSRSLHDWLRKLARRGCVVGAIGTGSEVLANAGILDGVKCTIHWENHESFLENHPDALLTGGIYEIDRNVITAAGGTASLDMMLNWISRTNDEFLASAIAEQFIHDHLRAPGEFQRNVEIRLVRQRSQKLASAMELMTANIENTLSATDIARNVGLSIRQLERLFSKYRHKSLHRYYLDVRLENARRLVFHTGMTLLQISVATGFSSQAHFSRSYRQRYRTTPSRDRSHRQLADC